MRQRHTTRSHQAGDHQPQARPRVASSMLPAARRLPRGASRALCALPGGAPQQQQQQQQQSQQPPGTEQLRPYQVLRKGGAYDLRFYGVYPVVEMDYQRREEGYLALGSFQDGANAAGTRYGLTQPVFMAYHPDGRKVMSMMVGAPRQPQQQQQQQQAESGQPPSITDLPQPSDTRVRLAVAGGEVVAVMPFEGYITPEAAAAVRQKLLDALAADGLALAPDEARGFFRVAQYGQVYTLQARLNEMMLGVQI